MTHQHYLEQPYQDELESERRRDDAAELCFPDVDEWHPAIVSEYATYFDRVYAPGSDQPDTFDTWLDKQTPRDVAEWVTEHYLES